MLEIIGVFVSYIWSLFVLWLKVFFMYPFTSFSMIWIIVPQWVSWFFAEFFQEKRGVSFGNAISNGVIPFWVGIDWMRFLTTGLTSSQFSFSAVILLKYVISAFVILYGNFIIIYGIKGKSFIHLIGRRREVTYVLLAFTPLIYGAVGPTLNYFLSITLFFPVAHYIIELIDRYTPTPKIYDYDENRI